MDQDHQVLLSGLIGSVVGGILSCAGSWFAVMTTSRSASKQEIRRNKQDIHNVLQAIHDELDAIYTAYMDTVGNAIDSDPKRKTLSSVFVVGSDYFTMYKANAAQIGKIDDDHLRGLIIRTYSAAMSLIDRYNFNNDLYQRSQSMRYNGPNTFDMDSISAFGMMPSAYQSIKEKHNEVKTLYGELMHELHERGIKKD